MNPLHEVAHYLRQHWQHVQASPAERRADLRHYEHLPSPYGSRFTEQLRALLAEETHDENHEPI